MGKQKITSIAEEEDEEYSSSSSSSSDNEEGAKKGGSSQKTDENKKGSSLADQFLLIDGEGSAKNQTVAELKKIKRKRKLQKAAAIAAKALEEKA